ncbi:restriction endonuclease subunit S [Pseudomonadota bacterium 24LQ007]
MSLDTYPRYKNSNIEWIGEVPAHWRVASLRWYASIQGGVAKGKNYNAETPVVDLPYLRVANVQNGFCDLSSVSTVTVAVSEVDRYRLHPGDVLMNEGGDNDKLGRGAVWQGQVENCLHQNHVFAIRPNRHLLPYWLSMFTRSAAARSYFYLYSKQSTNLASISSSNVMSCPLPFPSTQEQRQILGFLDHETAKIDALIREQERLIELLQEKRQAVISHAVTKGLDPDVPMKDSGVEWLGEVPAHWEMVPLKYLCSFSGGGTPSKENLEYWNGDIPWVSPKDMKSFWVSNSIDKVTERAVAESSTSLVEPNALLMVVRSGILQRTIPVAINTVEVTLNQDMKALRFSMEGFERYFAMLVQGFEPSWLLEWRKQGATVESIEQEYLAESLIPVPPRDEMYAIVNKLAAVAKQYESLEDEAHKSSKLLRERRSALISAAVTGKIDVRNWQPPADESAFDEEVRQAGMEATA